jgi:hypothetical protein
MKIIKHKDGNIHNHEVKNLEAVDWDLEDEYLPRHNVFGTPIPRWEIGKDTRKAKAKLKGRKLADKVMDVVDKKLKTKSFTILDLFDGLKKNGYPYQRRVIHEGEWDTLLTDAVEGTRKGNGDWTKEIKAFFELDRREVFRFHFKPSDNEFGNLWRGYLMDAEKEYRDGKIEFAIDYLLKS